MSGQIELAFGDGDRTFCLKLAQLRALEESRGCGTGALQRRVISGDWYADDVREIIRLGLIGGGLGVERALELVRTYVDDMPLNSLHMIAAAILMAALVGPPIDGEDQQEDDAPGKHPRETATMTAASLGL